MPTSLESRLDHHPALAETACHIFYAACSCETINGYLQAAIPVVNQAAGSEWAAVVRGEKGVWRKLAAIGADRPLPEDLLAEAIDSETPIQRGDWIVVPLAALKKTGELLLVFRAWEHAAESRGILDSVADWLGEGLQAVRQREQEQQRSTRLEAVLSIASQWQQKLELEPLLHQMAETSARLLGAERATIFLWDRVTKTLVGRPALGVEGGELRIPESTGVVGQVVHSLQSRRVDADIRSDQQEIDRRVDKQLKFQTRSLVCVPLLAPSGDCLGAFEVINKIRGNFSQEDETALRELAEHAAIALEKTRQFEAVLNAHRYETERAADQFNLLGNCPAIESLRRTVERVAATELAVLVLGENGTGKEVVSQKIHYGSRRRDELFVAVNCAAIPDTLLESELFGHEKGAFTDARETRPGKFELAARGTLFLDEIGDLSLSGQSKLLRVLEEKVVVRVGGSRPIATNARIVAATNQNLGELVRQKKFREDLFFRLNVVTLEIPALRERGDDVVILAEHFLHEFAVRSRRTLPKLTTGAKKRLLEHTWPGNVRELRNLMERVTFLLPEGQKVLDAADLQFILAPDNDAAQVMNLDVPLTEATRRFQMEYIRRHIDSARGNMTLAAERLGIHRSNLYRKMGQLGMETQDE